MAQLDDRRSSFAQYLKSKFSDGHREIADHLSEVPDEEILNAYMKGHMTEAIVLDDSQVNHILLENSSNEEAYKALSEARHQKHIDEVRASVALKFGSKLGVITHARIPDYPDFIARLTQMNISIADEDIDDILRQTLSFYSDWICDERAWRLEVHRSQPRMAYQEMCEACLLAQSMEKYPTFSTWMTGELTGEMQQDSEPVVKCEMYSSQVVEFMAGELLELFNEGAPYNLTDLSKVMQNRLRRIHGEFTTALFLYLSAQSLYTAWAVGLPITQREEQNRSELAEFMNEVEKHFRTLYPQGCPRNQHKKFLCDLKNLAATLDADKLWMLSNEGIPMDLPQNLINKAQSIIERELEKKASADGKETL
jgi:hypothetical protein